MLFGHRVLTFLPCGGNLDHHLGTFQSDLGRVGFFVLNLSCINNHLLGHRRYLYRGVCDVQASVVAFKCYYYVFCSSTQNT